MSTQFAAVHASSVGALARTGFSSGTLTSLRARVRGSVSIAEDHEYDRNRAAWNLTVDQRPIAVAMPVIEEDFAVAVDFAREQGLGVAVQATGHGVSVPATAGVLVNTSRMACRAEASTRSWSDSGRAEQTH